MVIPLYNFASIVFMLYPVHSMASGAHNTTKARFQIQEKGLYFSLSTCGNATIQLKSDHQVAHPEYVLIMNREVGNVYFTMLYRYTSGTYSAVMTLKQSRSLCDDAATWFFLRLHKGVVYLQESCYRPGRRFVWAHSTTRGNINVGEMTSSGRATWTTDKLPKCPLVKRRADSTRNKGLFQLQSMTFSTYSRQKRELTRHGFVFSPHRTMQIKLKACDRSMLFLAESGNFSSSGSYYAVSFNEAAKGSQTTTTYLRKCTGNKCLVQNSFTPFSGVECCKKIGTFYVRIAPGQIQIGNSCDNLTKAVIDNPRGSPHVMLYSSSKKNWANWKVTLGGCGAEVDPTQLPVSMPQTTDMIFNTTHHLHRDVNTNNTNITPDTPAINVERIKDSVTMTSEGQAAATVALGNMATRLDDSVTNEAVTMKNTDKRRNNGSSTFNTLGVINNVFVLVFIVIFNVN